MARDEMTLTGDKKRLWQSFTIGAVTAPLLFWLLLFASSQSSTAALRGLPITIISNPFLDITTPSGRQVSIGEPWLWLLISVAGGTSGISLTALARALLRLNLRA